LQVQPGSAKEADCPAPVRWFEVQVEPSHPEGTVPTIQLRVLYVFFILAHDRRRVLHFNVTEHPTASPWTRAARWNAQFLLPRGGMIQVFGPYGDTKRPSSLAIDSLAFLNSLAVAAGKIIKENRLE
jgi:hypothetical protein